MIASVSGGPAWHSTPELWRAYFREQCDGARIALLAFMDNSVVGYGSLVLASEYAPFRAARIPEINNLVVAHHVRRRGVGTALIAALEEEARKTGYEDVGIGVGLYPDYGPAQRLYVKLGFVPDGRSATYRYAPAEAGSIIPVDDDLAVWMTKPLRAI